LFEASSSTGTAALPDFAGESEFAHLFSVSAASKWSIGAPEPQRGALCLWNEDLPDAAGGRDLRG